MNVNMDVIQLIMAVITAIVAIISALFARSSARSARSEAREAKFLESKAADLFASSQVASKSRSLSCSRNQDSIKAISDGSQ
ncbi:MAG: hypothetical protein WCG61_05130 [Chlorobium sp.]